MKAGVIVVMVVTGSAAVHTVSPDLTLARSQSRSVPRLYFLSGRVPRVCITPPCQATANSSPTPAASLSSPASSMSAESQHQLQFCLSLQPTSSLMVISRVRISLFKGCVATQF